MKNLFKKFHKALTVVMCLALVLETINLTSISVFAADGDGVVTTSGNDFAAEDVSGNEIVEDVSGNDIVTEDVSGNDVSGNDISGNDVSGNDVSGNDVSGNDVSGNEVPEVSAETQKAEDDLTAIAQKAVAATQYQLEIANKFEISAGEHAGRAQTSYNKVIAAAGANYALIDVVNSVSKFAGYAQGSAERSLKAYETAQSDLEKWTTKFEEALEKAQAVDADVTGEAAKAVLAQAQSNVDAAKLAYDNAQADADTANELVAQAQASFEGKEVVANFYVLNRGLEQPEEIQKHPQTNYSNAVAGKLYRGVETDGVRDDSYLILYHNGLVTDIDTYILEAPTAEAFGIELAENEEIVWYVIKTESGNIHVNGIITVVENNGEDTTGGDENTGDDTTGGDENTGDDTTGGDENTGDDDTTDGDGTNTGNNNPPANNPPVNNPPAGNEPTDNTPNTPNTQEQTQTPVVVEPEENDAEAPVEDEVEEVEEVVETETEPVEDTTEDAGVTEDVSVNEIVEIEDEEVALASGIEDADGAVVEVEDEEVPLAAHSSCAVHWIILIVTLLYTVFELIRGISRGKRISELKEEAENEMA